MASRPRYPRSTCVVLGCHRWSTLFPHEWICGQHWRLVDRRLKAIRALLMKRRRREYEAAKAQTGAAQARLPAAEHDVWAALDFERRALKRWHCSADLLWRRMKRQAIKRAAGI